MRYAACQASWMGAADAIRSTEAATFFACRRLRSDVEMGKQARTQGAMMRYTSLLGLFCAGLFLNSPADAQSPSGVVRIGILNDQSGPYADFGGKTSVDAARMTVEDVGGKVLG